MIKRQILLIKQHFSSYSSSEEDTELRIERSQESGIWPLVDHISSFEYPNQFSQGVLKLCNFPFEKEEKDKWINDFSFRINNGRMFYFHTFTEKDAVAMQSTLGEIMYALEAIQLSVPFITIRVKDDSEFGKIQLIATDKLMEEYNLIRTVGGTD